MMTLVLSAPAVDPSTLAPKGTVLNAEKANDARAAVRVPFTRIIPTALKVCVCVRVSAVAWLFFILLEVYGLLRSFLLHKGFAHSCSTVVGWAAAESCVCGCVCPSLASCPQISRGVGVRSACSTAVGWAAGHCSAVWIFCGPRTCACVLQSSLFGGQRDIVVLCGV